MQHVGGKVAVVTGAASGIGRALAEAFAAEGAKVVLADVEQSPLEAAETALREAGGDVLGVVTDVSDRESVDALARRTVERFGTVHVLCNNAGVGGGGMIADVSLADWEWVLGVNLWGVVHGLHSFLPHLLAHGEEGHIVNTASMAGLVGGPGIGPYNASKFAVVGISETLHHELAATGSRVKVSVLCPGWVRTNILDSQRNRPERLSAERPKAQPDAHERVAAVRRIFQTAMPPEEVAQLVLAAIREERFWVFTHPEMLRAVTGRTDAMVAGRNPVLDLAAFAPVPRAGAD